MSQEKDTQKKDRLSMYLSEIAKKKLDCLQQTSEKSKTEIVNKMIEHGVINVILNGKDILRNLCELNNYVNQTNLQVTDDIRKVQETLDHLEHLLKQKSIPADSINAYLSGAKGFLLQVQQKYSTDTFQVREQLQRLGAWLK